MASVASDALAAEKKGGKSRLSETLGLIEQAFSSLLARYQPLFPVPNDRHLSSFIPYRQRNFRSTLNFRM